MLYGRALESIKARLNLTKSPFLFNLSIDVQGIQQAYSIVCKEGSYLFRALVLTTLALCLTINAPLCLHSRSLLCLLPSSVGVTGQEGIVGVDSVVGKPQCMNKHAVLHCLGPIHLNDLTHTCCPLLSTSHLRPMPYDLPGIH